ncbi:TNF receptor-associated factor 2 [Lacerta agilis]|uniref:TNF receptor-associated factor 2 n=1 Tax=Lacerta agilis TaxID=80427 RepID=UPI00141A3514|nr:TNF receptor-associated factor 2 [Lacerta agilis]
MAAGSCTPPGSLDAARPGFPKEILRAELEGKYLCSECEDLLRRPFQAQCGHRYCSYCLKNLISSGPQPCAACLREGLYEEGVSVLDSGSAFPDNAARREVESLPAACTRKDCPWKGTIKEYEAHDEVCPKFPLTCDGCGKTDVPREMFAEHVRSCGKCRVPCRFRPVGCGEVVENQGLPLHEAQNLPEHLGLLLSFALRLATGGTRPDTGDAHELGVPHPAEDPHLVGAPHPAKDPHLPGFPHPLTDPPLPRPAGSPPSWGALAGPPWEALERKASTFEKIVCVLNREVERVAAAAEEAALHRRREQERAEALAHKIRQLERSLALKETALAEVEAALRCAEAATYDGVFVWKVGDVGRKRQEAMAGRAPAIFSPAFYTSRYGYKMCLRLYLNGDGTGRGTHLSLFFVLMKGPSDALLKWPFNQKVTLMLLDQDHREHVIDAFRPDVTSSSFQRPTGDMNVASGCPLFCPLAKMAAKDSYVRDDTLFIKAIVDLAGL